MRILLAEDDPMIGAGIREGLRQDGFAVDWVRDGHAARLALAENVHDLLVLDLGLPREDGLAVLRGMRRSGDARPVLILTARDAVVDRVAGLDAGADDYVVKPVAIAELAARLRALVRRASGTARGKLEAGPLSVDPASRTVTWRGDPVELAPREFDVLLALLLRAGRVVTRDQLASALYEWDRSIESNALEVHVHHLRRKLAPDLIRTVRGVGYMVPADGGATPGA
jgi:two-component system OmpR family response regulator/two-component system response regulator QseB